MAVVGEVSSIQLPNGNEYEILDKDAALAKTPTDISATEETFVYQKSSGESCKYLTSIKGKSVVWNQLIQNGDFQTTSNWTAYSGTLTVSNNVGTYTITSVSSQSYGNHCLQVVPIKAGHVYYCSIEIKTTVRSVQLAGDIFGNSTTDRYIDPSSSWQKRSGIATIPTTHTSTSANFYGFISGTRAVGDSYQMRNAILIDLTLLGLGSLTTTGLQALYPKIPNAYQPGILRNNSAIAIETTMFNQWDGQYSVLGKYLTIEGVETSSPDNNISSYVKVFPSTAYYLALSDGSALGNFSAVCWYDADKNFISGQYFLQSTGLLVTSPANAAYFRFSTNKAKSGYIFNLSDPERNGTYEPYKTHIVKTGCDKIEVKSPNICDEVWEIGSYDEDGNPIDASDRIRTTNPIAILPNTEYYAKCATGKYLGLRFYDADDNNLTGTREVVTNQKFTTPACAAYLRFSVTDTTTYNNDITINLSGWANGRYFPHGILTFEDDMRSAGSVYNEIDLVRKKYAKRVGVVDMGSLDWYKTGNTFRTIMASYGAKYGVNLICQKYVTVYRPYEMTDKTLYFQDSYYGHDVLAVADSAYSDVATFKAAMSGVILNYELSTEEVYELANPTEMWVFADKDGTERVIYPESTIPYAPFRCDSFYATISAEAINDSLNLVENRMVSGPAESTDEHVVVFNGEDGKSVKDSGLTIATSVPSGAVFTDTHRPIKVNSTQLLGDNATPVNFVAAGSATVVGEGDTITIASPPNRAAASGGTDTSVVTTGDKYTWNNKYVKPSSGIPKTDLASDVQTSLGNADTALQTHQSAFAAVSVLDTYINASQPGDSIAILPGNNVTITPDAANKRITISATDTNTHRPVQVNGTEILGNTTEPLNIAGGNGITVSGDASGVMISADVYQSKSAASGGTTLSLVTTGEKYIWNTKMSSGDIIRSTKVTYLTISIFAATISSSEQATVIIGNQPATGQARSITLPGQPGDGRCFRFYHIQGNPTFYSEQITTAYGTGRAIFKLFRSDVQAVSDQESFSVNDTGLVVEFVFCESMGNFGTWLVHHSMIY